MDIAEIINDLSQTRKIKRHHIWEPFMEKYKCQKICEIGVRDGNNFDLMIEHSPELAVAIDVWCDDSIPSHNDMGYSQSILDKQYEDFVTRISDKPFVKVYREYSYDAVKHFPVELFDLVYIDADHSYKGCLKDITDWFTKVKKNGFLIGDDFRDMVAHRTGVKFGVKEAVADFAKTNNLAVYELPNYGWVIMK